MSLGRERMIGGDGERERVVPQPFAAELRFRQRRECHHREFRATAAHQLVRRFGVDELDVEFDVVKRWENAFSTGARRCRPT